MEPICKNCRHWRIAGQFYNEQTGDFNPNRIATHPAITPSAAQTIRAKGIIITRIWH